MDDRTRRRLEHEMSLPGSEWHTPTELARRWRVSVSTVRAIPAHLLPYLEMGGGLRLKRRRYHNADVVTYEAQKVAA